MKIANPMALILDWEENGVDPDDVELQKAIAAAILSTGLYRSAGRYGRFVEEVYEAHAEVGEDGERTLVISEEFLA